MKNYNIVSHKISFVLILILLSVTTSILQIEIKAQSDEEIKFKIWEIPNIDDGAEFYFSPDGKSLIGNAKLNDDTVHQVYTFTIDGKNILKINDKGEDACSFYFPDGKHLIYTSTKDNLQLLKSGATLQPCSAA